MRIPNLSGCVCTAFLAEDIWFRGKRSQNCNAFYLQVNGNRWHRFRVDCRGIRWKAVDSPDRLHEEERDFRLRAFEDREIVGGRIQRIDYWEREPYGEESEECEEWLSFDDSAIRIQFIGGFVVEVRHCWHDLALDFFRLEPNQIRRKHRHYGREPFALPKELLTRTINEDVRARLEALDKEATPTVDMRADE